MHTGLAVSSECRFQHNDDLTVALAARIWDLLAEAIEQYDEAGMVLAGGSTPVGLYNVLHELPLPWTSLKLCLSDERWVDVNDPASNEGMLMRELTPGMAAETLISMAQTTATPEEDADRVDRALRALSRPWDLVLLGMGNDGHTASLFPQADGLAEALNSEKRCVPVDPGNGGHTRLTLSKRELLNSSRIILLIRGQEKWQVYCEALSGTDVSSMPVRAILHQQQVPVDVYWSLD
ncbi:MAG: 6-phosphogluconolactonase [Gammaproteobacteria bacterium]|nr:6-phosphogluconolactonase [Gammaproteobacteria bacterium]MDH3768323.1 6-phosphogluconolactonase [Gammaproteobacteria bacterium]